MRFNFDCNSTFQHELETLEHRPWQFEMGLKQEPKEVKDTPLTIIDRPEQIPDLVGKLGEVREIAVDLEAHSYRSYLGFTCLMQVRELLFRVCWFTSTACMVLSYVLYCSLTEVPDLTNYFWK